MFRRLIAIATIAPILFYASSRVGAAVPGAVNKACDKAGDVWYSLTANR